MFEFEISYKILNYDLDNINKEIIFCEQILGEEITNEYATKRLENLYLLKKKKEESIIRLIEKYKK